MRVTCHLCDSTVTIKPPRFRCSECGADLSALSKAESGPVFLLEDEIQGYYQRAAEQALAKKETEALATIQNGLARSNAAELHLLAALIHRKRGEHDEMRRHVAAIPVEDALRREAEWLLRSHQEKQRALRQSAQGKRRRSDLPAGPSNLPNRFLLDEFAPPPPAQKRSRLAGWLWSMPALLLLVTLLWWQFPLFIGWIEQLPIASIGNPGQESVDSPAVERTAGEEGQSSASPDDESASQSHPVEAATPDAFPTPLPATLPTPTVPANIAEAVPTEEPQPEALAASGSASTLFALAPNGQPFDLATYLRLVGRQDLSTLPINSRRRDASLILAGIVTSTQVRNDLLEVAGRIPGINEVNGIDLLIRLPETYTVQPNDTLWNIAFTLYGDGNRWPELLEANRELLRDGTLLVPGQELTVPPL
jgi:nucleoid-associated protein YgaU